MPRSSKFNERHDETTALLMSLRKHFAERAAPHSDEAKIIAEIDKVLDKRLKEFERWGYITEWAPGEKSA
jgi:hypothetical protein